MKDANQIIVICKFYIEGAQPIYFGLTKAPPSTLSRQAHKGGHYHHRYTCMGKENMGGGAP